MKHEFDENSKWHQPIIYLMNCKSEAIEIFPKVVARNV